MTRDARDKQALEAGLLDPFGFEQIVAGVRLQPNHKTQSQGFAMRPRNEELSHAENA
jgi:hypothetical protein